MSSVARELTRRLVLAAALLGVSESPVEAGDGVCAGTEARVVVESATHRLTLCEEGREQAGFAIRLGRGGMGKVKEGDGKTPLGTYPLGRPRKSASYGTFIPIGYPTLEQRQRGHTGGDVGLHGPPRSLRWLGALVNTFDGSDGCVGLATDAEITTIADWVKKTRARTIEIR